MIAIKYILEIKDPFYKKKQYIIGNLEDGNIRTVDKKEYAQRYEPVEVKIVEDRAKEILNNKGMVNSVIIRVKV